MTPHPLLRLEGVSKRFGSLTVTDDVSLTVAQGEALGILGPNGAGKSTLFNLITGNLAPDRGTVRFGETDITRMPAHRRSRIGIARSHQIPLPFTGMTVFENLLVGAGFAGGLGEEESHRRCVEVLARTGLLAKANHPAGRLTLLERKRLELARALAAGPRLLLLDEIAGGLTEAECHALVATIREVHASGVTIVWIEHVLHALLGVVGRLAVLNFGRLIAAGPPREVMNRREVREVYLGVDAEIEVAHGAA